MKTVPFQTRLKLSDSQIFNKISIKFKPPNQGSLSELAISNREYNRRAIFILFIIALAALSSFNLTRENAYHF